MENENKIRLQRNRSSQSESRRSREDLLQRKHKSSSKGKSDKIIRYFSMFTGVGGFELGFERTNNDKFNTETQNNDERLQSNTSKCNGDGGRSCSNDFKSTHICKESKSQEYTQGGKWSSNEQGTQLCLRKNTTFSCVGFSEIDKYASELLSKKFPSVKNWGDCTKINPRELPDFDLLCGGFPCQSFSIAGKRKGFQDTRGTMFFEIARILKVKRPKLILLENVKGLLNHEKGKTFSVILQTLEELGYRTQWMVLNSKFFGVPQNRERVFIIGSLRGETRPEILPFRESYKEFNGKENSSGQSWAITATYGKGNKGTQIQVKGMLTEEGWEKRHENIRRVYRTEGIAPTIPTAQGGGVMTKIAIPVLTPDRESKRQHGRRFKEDGEPSFTLTGQDVYGIMEIQKEIDNGGRITRKDDGTSFTLGGGGRNSGRNQVIGFEEIKIRRLTPTECERLQSFPDNWTEGFSDTQRYKMMGNAVTTNVISAIAEKLK